MKMFNTSIIIALVITSVCLADTTWIAGGDDYLDIEGVWSEEGNPYIFTRDTRVRIRNQDTLEISSGTDIVMDYSSLIFNRGSYLLINGTPENPVNFRPLRNGSVAGIGAEEANAEGTCHTEMRYCQFGRLIDEDNEGEVYVIGIMDDSERFIMENCKIENCLGGVSIRAHGLIRDCLFKEVKWAINTSQFHVDIQRCVVQGGLARVNVALSNDTARVQQCFFIDYGYFWALSKVWVTNSILVNPTGYYLSRGSFDDNPSDWVRYNCFWGAEKPYFGIADRNHPDTLTQVGILNTINRNGDSCDAYGNIFLDPRIVEDWEWGDQEFLMEDSPCIDAGDPEAPLDPDSTIADIGPFFFSQPNIAVSVDSLTFEETLVGEADNAFFSIRNRGDQKTLLYFIEEDSLSRVFFVNGWLGDTAGVEPGETVEFSLIFIPDEAREYLDTLRIVSNDRDEGVIEIFVRAFGASSVRGDEEVGQAGTPILLSVSPNPFNSTVTIRYAGGLETAATRLGVYDVNGREVFSAATDPKSSGKIPPPAIAGGDSRTLVWDASASPAGIYFVRLQAGGETRTVKTVLMR